MTEREATRLALASWDMAVYACKLSLAEKTEESYYSYAVRRSEAQSAFYGVGMDSGFQGPFLVGYGD